LQNVAWASSPSSDFVRKRYYSDKMSKVRFAKIVKGPNVKALNEDFRVLKTKRLKSTTEKKASNQHYLQGIISNNAQIVQEIYDQFFPGVVRWLERNQGKRADAEDVFQEALMAIFNRLKKGDLVIEHAFNTYLFAICKRIWFKRLKKPDFHVTSTDELALNSSESELITQSMERSEKMTLFRSKLLQLGADCQKVLQLHFAKKSFAEIAQLLKYTSEEYARRKKYLCKNELTKLIKADVRYRELAI